MLMGGNSMKKEKQTAGFRSLTDASLHSRIGVSVCRLMCGRMQKFGSLDAVLDLFATSSHLWAWERGLPG